MKKHFVIFVIVFLVTIGFAAANTVLDITGSLNVAENLEDFKIEITNLKINNSDSKTLISKDKQSFTFTGSGNDTINYTVTNYSYQYDASISLICIPSDNITVEQISNLPAQSKNSKVITSTSTNETTCTINVEKISRTDYADDMCLALEGTEWTFDYTGAEQEFTVPCDGNYKIEAWGAKGGDDGPSTTSISFGGYGAYSYGNVALKKADTIYVTVGSEGHTYPSPSTSYNGGGIATDASGAGGGGATHIANYSRGILINYRNNINNLLIVAGGGGGAGDRANGGHAGGIRGVNGFGTSPGGGATQNSGYSFGKGENAIGQNPAGGGGYYGGYRSNGESLGGGGGGSSYIGNPLLTNKAMYCYNCAQSSEESTKTISTTCASSTPTANCAKQGNGYAKITYLGK